MTVTVRMSEEEHAMLARLAEKDGLSQSDVLRRLLRTRGQTLPPKGRRVKSSIAADGLASVELDTYTIVHDLNENETIMRVEGQLALPMGAEIELVDPNVNARVVRVRLLAGNPATLCLDVVKQR